jgi:hypothetical protein
VEWLCLIVCCWRLLQVLSDWDRFARGEYLRLAVEEEPDDMQVCPTEGSIDRSGWLFKRLSCWALASSTCSLLLDCRMAWLFWWEPSLTQGCPLAISTGVSCYVLHTALHRTNIEAS